MDYLLPNVEKLRPFDDKMLYLIGRYDKSIMEDFLKVILNDSTLEFKNSTANIFSLYSPPDDKVITEFTTDTNDGTVIGFITFKQNEIDVTKKVRWYQGIKDSHYLINDYDYTLLPNLIIVVLMERDIFNSSEPMYEVIKKIKDTDIVYDDDVRIILVNGEYKGNDPLGNYIHDFMCDDVDSMRIDSIKEAVKFFEAYGE